MVLNCDVVREISKEDDSKVGWAKAKNFFDCFCFLQREPFIEISIQGITVLHPVLRAENLNVCTICRVRAHITSFSCVEITPP